MSRTRNLWVSSLLVTAMACIGCDAGSSEEPAKPTTESSAASGSGLKAVSAEGEAKCGVGNYAQVEAELRKVAEKAAEQCRASGSLPTDGAFEGDRSKFRWAATQAEQNTTYELGSSAGPSALGLRLTCYAADCACGPIASTSLAGEYATLEEAYTMMTLHRVSGSILAGARNGAERLLGDHVKEHPNGELASVREAYRRRSAAVVKAAGEGEPSTLAATPSSHTLQCGVEGREGIEAALLEMSAKAVEQCKETGEFPLQDVFAGDDKKYMWFAQSSGGRALYDVQALGAPTTSGLRQACYEDGCICDPPVSKTLRSEYTRLEGALKQLLYHEAGSTPVPSDPSRLDKAERALDRHARDYPKGALSAVRERYRRELVEAKKTAAK